MIWRVLVLVSALFTVAGGLCIAEPGIEGRNLLSLENGVASVIVDFGGGAIVDFHLKGHDLNPLNWNYPEKGDLNPRLMGHFICFDRWGQPSRSEGENGMPFHGEATNVNWDIPAAPEHKAGGIVAEMSCVLPIGRLSMHRTLKLDDTNAVLTVKEEIKNVGKLGRVYNIVQHSTYAPPFLDESVLADTNVKKGFTQLGRMPTPEEPVVYWPKTVFEGRLFDFRRLIDDIGPGVVSYVFDDDVRYGWATACNPPKGLLIGYIWDTAEYPWLNFWYQVEDGKPAARGIEFGTTGLHQPFKILLKKNMIFGRPLYEYIDAEESIVKSYTMFLALIPTDYRGVADIGFGDGVITLKEHGGDTSRDIVVSLR